MRDRVSPAVQPGWGVEANRRAESGERGVKRERLSRLSETCLRISESLDVDTVLREVVESARALTGAGCSGITTMDASGHLQDSVTAGVSSEDYQQFLHLPHGPGLWEYLRAIPQPLRLRDLAAHLGPLGFPDDPALARSFLGTPIRHRGVQVGNFFLADKAGGQAFTQAPQYNIRQSLVPDTLLAAKSSMAMRAPEQKREAMLPTPATRQALPSRSTSNCRSAPTAHDCPGPTVCPTRHAIDTGVGAVGVESEQPTTTPQNAHARNRQKCLPEYRLSVALIARRIAPPTTAGPTGRRSGSSGSRGDRECRPRR